MGQHEKKPCPRCGQLFECKTGNISQCECSGFSCSPALKAYLEERYDDCLCPSCLEALSNEVTLFLEKYVYLKK